MLSGIFGKKPDHPMADIKAAQALLDELPKNDAHKMLMELTEWIESVSDNADFKPEHQFAVLCLLDETAQLYARKLTRDYFTPNELNKFQENRLWLALDNFFHNAAKAYLSLFERCCDGGRGVAALKAQIPLLAARALCAMTGQLKFACARYELIDSAIWANVAKLWQHAERQQYLDKPLILYPGANGDATVKRELGHLLGWHSCGINTLSPLHMHLTERLTNQYCSGIGLCATRDGSNSIGFDLEHPAAPVRAGAGWAAQPSSARFISMAAIQPKLEALLKALEKNIVPDELNLGGVYEAEPVREAARHLLVYLVDPPARRGARHRINASLNVVNGFSKLSERTDFGLNFSEEQPVHCEVENISASGFRTVLPAQGTDGIRIGSLLGIRPDGMPHWGAAVVRRLNRDDKNRLQVGAEMLSSQIIGVPVSQSGGGTGFEDGQPALWLQAKRGELPDEARLLMKAGTFSAHRSLQIRLSGKSYLLIPGMLQEKGADYDLAKFRIIEQETGSE